MKELFKLNLESFEDFKKSKLIELNKTYSELLDQYKSFSATNDINDPRSRIDTKTKLDNSAINIMSEFDKYLDSLNDKINDYDNKFITLQNLNKEIELLKAKTNPQQYSESNLEELININKQKEKNNLIYIIINSILFIFLIILFIYSLFM